MADSSSSVASSGPSKPQAPPKPQNPVFKMMGLPNMRFKLPSRNWMIFLTITGSFASAMYYDRREKRRAQQKWCELVSHLADEPLPVEQMRRKLTIYLSAPPGDGLRTAREHFKAYVKPVLSAAALDYMVVEGRREGDVRAAAAENIRKFRRKAGEQTSATEEPTVEMAILDTREKIGVHDEPGPKGDLVIGRHTWREYIRGLHEGWLGPMDAPPPPPVELAPEAGAEEPLKDIAAGAPSEVPSGTENSPKEETKEETKETPNEEKKEEEKPAKPVGPTPAYNTPVDYASAQLPRTLPESFDASMPIEFPHILGFLNTPIRFWRYLHQRHVANDIGREVATIVLAHSARPYREDSFDVEGADANPSPAAGDLGQDLGSTNYEQLNILKEEEKSWHKSVLKREEGDERERVWLDDMVIDPRIASRMKLATLTPEDEARSERLAEQQEYIIGRERPAPVSFWQQMWVKYGYGEDEETIRRKPIYGNIDGEDA